MRFSIAITARSILWGQHMVIAQNAAASIFSAALATVTVSYITDFGSTSTSPTSAPTPTVSFSEPIAICDYVFEGINQEGGGGGRRAAPPSNDPPPRPGAGAGFQTNIDNYFFYFYIADYNEHEMSDESTKNDRFVKKLGDEGAWAFTVGHADYGGTHNMYAEAAYDYLGINLEYCRIAFDGGDWIYGTVKQHIDTNIVSTITSKCIVSREC